MSNASRIAEIGPTFVNEPGAAATVDFPAMVNELTLAAVAYSDKDLESKRHASYTDCTAELQRLHNAVAVLRGAALAHAVDLWKKASGLP